MQIKLRSVMLGLALMASVALSGCLQDEKDPAAPADMGKLTGTFYAAGLGNVALQLQNAVMGDTSWFESLSDSMELDLASRGISPNALGSPVKSFICPIGGANATSVYQVTWIDGRNDDNKFTVKGIGTSAGSIVSALRARVAPYQIGLYEGGSSIAMADGNPLQIPSGCSGLNIPVGAPVLAFKIDRPAPPTETLFRTEYRTADCGADDRGLAKRGKLVQKRTIEFRADGQILQGGWEDENLGQCVEDVVIQITQNSESSSGSTADLGAFANVMLRDLLMSQLVMKCTTATVEEKERSSKQIDNCGNVRPNTNTAVSDINAADNTDVRILACSGATPLNMIVFNNLRNPKVGLRTTTWPTPPPAGYTGQAVIRRMLDNRIVEGNTAQGQEANRQRWTGTDIDCGGHQTFYVACNLIPGDPPLQPRQSGSKWLSHGVQGWFVAESWFAGAFNLCWFGSCTRVVGGSVTYLNPAYFTGTSIHSYGGTTTRRAVEATTWADPYTFKPSVVPASLWRVPDETNYCIWEQRVMIANCPFLYDPGQQGSWEPGYKFYHGRPTALDPGINGGGSSAGQIYNASRNQGYLTSNVSLLWEECNFKGCNYWWESAGPGDTYIKAWNTAPMAAGVVYLSPSAKEIRTGMCQDLNFTLNSTTLLQQARDQLAQKNAVIAVRQGERNAAQTAMNNAAGVLDSANDAVMLAEGAVDTAENNVNTRTSEQQVAQAAYDADPTNVTKQNQLATANANLSAAQTALTDAQDDLAAEQATQASAQTAFNTAQTAYNAALVAYNTAVAERDVAAAQLAEAEAAASMGVGREMTPDERQRMQTVYNGICANPQDTLSSTEQQMIRSFCAAHYNTNEYAMFPALGNYCDEVFDKSGAAAPYTLEFKPTTAPGFDIQTTLLNREGVMLAHKPTLPDNNTLVVTQRDFTQPLECLRQEERYYSWPKIYYYWVCGGKGGCWLQTGYQWFTVTESTTRQWTGLSYHGGSWSLPSYGFRSPYGTWSSLSQIPYPLY